MGLQSNPLRALLEPKSVAIVGASDDLSKINGRTLKYLLEFKYAGRILPINPKYTQIAGVPCYPSVDAIEGEIDLAVIAVAAKYAEVVLASCAKRGVKSAVVFTSGFAEMGETGRIAQERIGALARETGMRICGPNSLGVVNLGVGAVASFSQTLERKPPSGPVGFITQSGAFGTSLFALALESGLAFKYFISTGNEADLEFTDYADFLIDDPEVQVIAGYIEGLKNGKGLERVARKAALAGKPIVVAKVGRTSAGTRAARSHTGSMTGSDAVYSVAFEELGIVRPDTEEQLLDYIFAFLGKAKAPKGRGLGIVTMSGGAGVLASDRSEQAGLIVPELQPETRKQLANVVPQFGATGNPVDITAQFIAEPRLLRDSVTIVDRDPGVGCTVFCLGLMDLYWKQVVADLEYVSGQVEKPLFVAWTAAPPEAMAATRAIGVPVFPTPTRAIDAIGAFVSRSLRAPALARGEMPTSEVPPEARRLIDAAKAEGRDHLLENEAKQLLASFGVPIPRGELVDTPAEAERVAQSLGYPVVLKAQAVGLLHKSEAKVIELNVRDAAQLRVAYERVMANAREHCTAEALRGVLVEEMVPCGTETIAGLTYDPIFGPVLLFGLGGIFTEVLRDVALGLCPMDPQQADALIRRVKGFPLLAGARGRAKCDVVALADAISRVSSMAQALEGIAAEVDINPLLVLPEGQGVRAADALITLR